MSPSADLVHCADGLSILCPLPPVTSGKAPIVFSLVLILALRALLETSDSGIFGKIQDSPTYPKQSAKLDQATWRRVFVLSLISVVVQ